MHNIFKTIVSVCLAAVSSFHHPQVLSYHDDNHHDDDHHEEQQLDLLLNGQHNPVGVVKLDDLKPGDDRYVDKDLYVDAKAQVYMHLKDLVPAQGAQTEPEIAEEHGVPKFDLQNYFYYDLTSGSTIIINFIDHILMPDAVSCWIPLGTMAKKTHLTVHQSFHFIPTVSNWAQGDTLTFTEEFIAIADGGPVPVTSSGRVWSPILKKCVPKPNPTPTPTPTPTPKPSPSPTPKPHKDDDKHDDKDKHNDHH